MTDESRLRAWQRAGAARRLDDGAGSRTALQVQALMSRPVITVDADARLGEARALLEEHRIHHLLVEDRGRIVGIISDRDVARALSPHVGRPSSSARDEATLDQPIYHVASFRLTVIDRRAPVEEAAAIFVERAISALPVVDDAGGICGIVTSRDLLRGLLACVLPQLHQESA